MKTDNLEAFKKASEKYGNWLGNFIKEEKKRDKKLIDILIPLIEKETIDIIIRTNKIAYEVFKEEIPPDNSLLHRHFESLINHFDCNIHEMTKDDILIIAKALNKNPLKSYFIPGD